MKSSVLITGASSGIGRSLAFEFAKRGFNLVLVARRLDELDATKSKLIQSYSIEVQTFRCDLSDVNDCLKLVSEKISDWKSISILVNNAGIGSHGSFANTDLNRELELATVQVQSTIVLSKHFLKHRDASRECFILNVSSVYAYVPVPFQAVYSACKAFLTSFGDALANEGHPNLFVTTLMPGSTKTEFRTRMGIQKKVSGTDSDTVAQIGVEALFRKWPCVVPKLGNQIFVFLVSVLPRKLAVKLILKINSIRGMN